MDFLDTIPTTTPDATVQNTETVKVEETEKTEKTEKTENAGPDTSVQPAETTETTETTSDKTKYPNVLASFATMDEATATYPKLYNVADFAAQASYRNMVERGQG